jgi:quercetin dioxygenase-like cupin family protein
MNESGPDPSLEPAADRSTAGLGDGTTRGQILRNASAIALATTLGAALFAKDVDTAAAAGKNPKNPSPRVPANLIEITNIDTNREPWQILTIQQTGAKIPFKPLLSDPDTGMQVFLIRYDAGFTNVWHTHPCAHGFWVIDGILEGFDRKGKHEFGPGNFAWFPEGGWMQHGATKVNDCTFLFITNKPFAIFYESDSDLPYPVD